MNNKKIINAIHANNNADLTSNVFVPFETGTTTGYIPKHLRDFFLDTGDFEFDGKTIRFAEGLEDKSGAMDKVRDLMIQEGAIKEKPSHYTDERLKVGGKDHIKNPEFTIDYAYYYAFGFQLDAVSVQMRGKINGEDKIPSPKARAKVLSNQEHLILQREARYDIKKNHIQKR